MEMYATNNAVMFNEGGIQLVTISLLNSLFLCRDRLPREPEGVVVFVRFVSVYVV